MEWRSETSEHDDDVVERSFIRGCVGVALFSTFR